MKLEAISSTDNKAGAIAYLLLEIDPGQIAPYEWMEARLGFNPREKHGYAFRKARDIAEENGYIFEAVYGIGLRRLTEPDKLHATKSKLTRARNSVRRGVEILKTIDGSGFSEKEIKDGLYLEAECRLVSAVTSEKGQNAVRTRMEHRFCEPVDLTGGSNTKDLFTEMFSTSILAALNIT